MEIEQYLTCDDQQLVALSLEGDNEAFNHLSIRYREQIRMLYMQRTWGNVDDADDLLQETFIKVYLNLHRYNPKYTFGQWLYTISRNTYIDYIRKRREDLSIDVVTDNGCGVSSSMLNPEDSYIRSQQLTKLEVILNSMNPKYKVLIEMRFYRELSYEEIAEELQLPMGTVKTQIHRAREILSRLISGDSDLKL